MHLSADEFIHRIRYYGFLSNRHRKEKLEHCRQLLGMAPAKEGFAEPAMQENYRDRYESLTGRSLRECPVCHRGRMISVKRLPEVPFFRQSKTLHDRVPIQLARSQNSWMSRARSGVVPKHAKPIAISQATRIWPRASPPKTPPYIAPGSYLSLPTPHPLEGDSHAPIKTHSTRTLQRFSPIHF